MMRWLWNILCSVSLLLCLVAVVLFFLGMHSASKWNWHDKRPLANRYMVSLDGNSIHFEKSPDDDFFTLGPTALSPIAAWDFCGFHYHRLAIRFWDNHTHTASSGTVATITNFSTRLDVPIALAALLPSIWLIRFIRHRSILRRREQLGLCPHCNYDLRAHNPGDRCPECGTPIPPQPSQP